MESENITTETLPQVEIKNEEANQSNLTLEVPKEETNSTDLASTEPVIQEELTNLTEPKELEEIKIETPKNKSKISDYLGNWMKRVSDLVAYYTSCSSSKKSTNNEPK
jgi:hypothetical protein